MPHLAILQNFKGSIRKKPIYFSKHNPKFWTFWDFALFQSHSTANLLQFSEKKSNLETGANIVFSANSIGKHRVKNAPIWEEDFSFHILKNMAQKKTMIVIKVTHPISQTLQNS